MELPIADIAVKDRGRKTYNKLQELAQSLKDNGLLQNIVVRKPRADEVAEGITQPYVLVAGGRRMAAMHLLDWHTVPSVTLLEDLPRWKQRALELEENLQRENMTWQEEVQMKLEIDELYKAENANWEQADTAKLLGASPSTITRDLKVAKAIREDPSLKLATSKKAATRQVEMKATIKQREKAAEQVFDMAGLQSRVVTADMREWLRQQPDGIADLLFTDLPWGIDYHNRPGNAEGTSVYDDSTQTTKDLVTDVVPQLLRVTNEQGWLCIVMNWELHFFLRDAIEDCCVVHYEYKQQHTATAECKYLHCEPIPWIWYRPNSRNNSMHPMLHASNDYELILVCNRGQGRLYTQGRTGNVLAFDSDYDARIHAMQKPDGLCEEIIRRLSLPGQMVLDPCYGSGSALRSAAKLGRDFRGCDLNPALRELATAYIMPFYRSQTMPQPTGKINPDEQQSDDEYYDEELGDLADLEDDQGMNDEEEELDFDDPELEELDELFAQEDE